MYTSTQIQILTMILHIIAQFYNECILHMFNLFSHATHMQQTTLEISRQNNGKSLYMKVKSLNTVEIIVAQGEIVHHASAFLPIATMFFKVICRQGIK